MRANLTLNFSENFQELEYSEGLIQKAILKLTESIDVNDQLHNRSINISFVSETEIKGLNQRFLQKNKPTNVLSFPSLPDYREDLLGEIAICPAVVKAESKAQGKKEHDHLIHLILHSILHLLGYDHDESLSAKEMEAIEVEALNKLGIANPY